MITFWFLLFVPFFIVGLPILIRYMKTGYWEGLKHSVMSVLATLIAIIVAVVLAKLTKFALSGLIAMLIPKALFAEMGVLSGLAASFVHGIVGIIVAFIFFLIYFIVAICVFKKLIVKIKLEKFKDDPTKAHSMWLGLGIRAIDAMVVSLLCLIPIYGLLAYTVPVASGVYSAVKGESEDDRILPYLRCAENHPMVVLSRVGPTSIVIDLLADLNIGNASVNLADMSRDIEDLLQQFNAISEATGDEKVAALQKLNATLRKIIVEDSWAYDFMLSLVDETREYVDTMPDAEERESVRRTLSSFDMTEEEFKDNAVTLIDFISYSIECGMIDCIRWDRYESLPDNYYVELGKLINYSDQAVALKKEIILQPLSSLFFVSPELFSEEAFNAAHDEARKKAQAFVDEHWGDGYVSVDQQKREAYSFICFMFKEHKISLIEGIASHPKFGADLAMQFVDSEMVTSYSDSWIEEVIAKAIKDCENAPTGGLELKECFDLVSRTVSALNYSSGHYYVDDDEKALSFIVDTIGEEYFITTNSNYGKELYAVIKAKRNIPPEEGVLLASVDFGSFVSLVLEAKSPNSWPDKEPDNSFKRMTEELVSETQLCKALKAIIEQNGNDPFGLGEKLNSDQKAVFEKCIDDAIDALSTRVRTVTVDSDGNIVFVDNSDSSEYRAELRENAKVIKQLIGIS